MTSIYIASLFSRRAEMEKHADRLKASGFDITAHWVYGGEDGLSNADIVQLDLDDIDRADMVMSFSLPYGTLYKGGGRCVEFGYGLAKGKEMVLIGERENVFHWDSRVIQFDTLDAFLEDYERETEYLGKTK